MGARVGSTWRFHFLCVKAFQPLSLRVHMHVFCVAEMAIVMYKYRTVCGCQNVLRERRSRERELGTYWVNFWPAIICSFYYEHIFKAWLTYPSFVYAIGLSDRAIFYMYSKTGRMRDCKNLRLRVCPSCYNHVCLNGGTVKTYGWESALFCWKNF